MKLPRSCTNMIIACSTRAGECVSYEDIKRHVWPAEAPKSWRIILSRCAEIIRSHHGAAALRNVYGKGYVWEPKQEDQNAA